MSDFGRHYSTSSIAYWQYFNQKSVPSEFWRQVDAIITYCIRYHHHVPVVTVTSSRPRACLTANACERGGRVTGNGGGGGSSHMQQPLTTALKLMTCN